MKRNVRDKTIIEICPECNGSGEVIEEEGGQQWGGGWPDIWGTCPTCNGECYLETRRDEMFDDNVLYNTIR